MRISGTEPSSVILGKTKTFKKLKSKVKNRRISDTSYEQEGHRDCHFLYDFDIN